jgi:hypothetical protein
MGVSSLVNRFHSSLSTRGTRRTLRILGSRMHRAVFPAPFPIHPFDLEHGVETSGLLYSEQLASGHAHDDHITVYWGTPPSAFHTILQQWQQTLVNTPYSIEDYTLLDIGSGKGRVLMMASAEPFQRIVGVELNPALDAIAQSNLTKWATTPHSCSDISSLNDDALTVPIPDSPTLLYIYNSFNLYVMLPLLDRLQVLALARTSPIDILYTQPQQAALLDAVPGIEVLTSGSVDLSPVDRAADAFASRKLGFRIYRLAGARNSA